MGPAPAPCGCQETWKIMKSLDYIQFGCEGRRVDSTSLRMILGTTSFFFRLSYWNKTKRFFTFFFPQIHFRKIFIIQQIINVETWDSWTGHCFFECMHSQLLPFACMPPTTPIIMCLHSSDINLFRRSQSTWYLSLFITFGNNNN